MLTRSILFLLAVASPLLAQGVNCQLLGTMNLHAPYNDIWGYAAPNGKEYAILMANTGTAIIDVTNPATPIERAFIVGPTSQWRDCETYGTYAYVCTEAAGGFQVIDLTNADVPVLIGTVGATTFGNTHTISIDQSTGLIYCNGTQSGSSPGVPVFNAAANPTNPPFVGNLLPRNSTNPNSTYFHDIKVQNGFIYGSMIYNGTLRIMTTAALPAPILSNVSTPGVFTHNCWPNAAGTIAATTDEVNGAVVKFWDITNKSAPVGLGQYSTNFGSIPHNAYIIGNLCHCSWYTEGYRCIDISNPNSPFEVASYDTWPGASGGFNGAWGCYPFLPSGNILMSDISTGLYIVKPQISDLSITHAPLVDTGNEDGPYTVLANVATSNTLASLNVVYSVNGGTPVTVPMAPGGIPNSWVASIPGQNAISTVRYHLEAADSIVSRRSPQQGEHQFFVGTRVRVFFDDCETDLGWTHGFVATQDDWQRAGAAGISGSSAGFAWRDPAGAYSGTACWGNDLGGPGFNGSYQNNVSNWLQSPVVPTSSVQGLRLRYRRWGSFNAGDTGRVLVNGTLVTTVPSLTADTSWQLVDIDISVITNAASTVQLRFELISNATAFAGGWQIDDIEVFTETDFVPPTFYGLGTAGTGGIIPTQVLTGKPMLGLTPSVDGSNLLGTAFAVLAVGFVPISAPALGVQVLVDPNNGTFYLWSLTTGTPGAAGVGTASWPLSVPNDPFLDNLYLYTQIGVFDTGGPGGQLSASNGMRFRLCSL